MNTATILVGNVLDRLKDIPDQTVQTCITSPPYWGLRDYGHDGQLGLEATPEQYVENMVAVFREVWRALEDDGVLWLNLGDSYNNPGHAKGNPGSGIAGRGHRETERNYAKSVAGLKNKDLVGIPWRVAFALQADGWYLRQDIIWHKPNPMPESVTDRCTKAHEYLFMLTKNQRYYFDNDAIREPLAESTKQRDKTPRGRSQNGGKSQESLSGYDYSRQGLGNMTSNPKGRNRRSVWTIPTKPFKEAHFAVMPEALCEPPILATSRPGDLILDPFTGSGTVAVVALRHGRNFVGVELNPKYAEIAERRISNDQPMINTVKIKAA